jgi:PAS domain S-box-containing protein
MSQGLLGMANRHLEWVAAWQSAVRASPLALSLIELAAARFIEVSSRAAELMGMTPEEVIGVDCLTFADQPQEAAHRLQLMREGRLDGIQYRGRVARPDGSVIETQSSAWAIRASTGPDLLLVASAVVSETEGATVPDDLAEVGDRFAAGTLDDRWRVEQISTDARQLLGQRPSELIGKSMIDLTHPDDEAALLLTFARATTETSAAAHLRLRHSDGSWRTVRMVMALVEAEGAPRFGFVLDRIDEAAVGSSTRIEQLEHHLRRIATEIHAADVLGASDRPLDLALVPVISELSARQWEVVSRLVRGQRVPTIADEMYLSQSTVRNHLSSIFRKAGVHSQRELMALLVKTAADPPPEE